ncbi:hypothetical protein HanIR_Chr09g0412401 [Helianthus annuus]|nr:hypothetical protein HanIR_Chr09g0412401 [Helianthus annuus]
MRMASSSFSQTERLCYLGDSALLMYAKGCPSCIKTAPIPLAEASVSTINFFVKSGSLRTGGVLKASLSCEKAAWASSFHLKPSFLSNHVRGLAKVPKPLTNLL